MPSRLANFWSNACFRALIAAGVLAASSGSAWALQVNSANGGMTLNNSLGQSTAYYAIDTTGVSTSTITGSTIAGAFWDTNATDFSFVQVMASANQDVDSNPSSMLFFDVVSTQFSSTTTTPSGAVGLAVVVSAYLNSGGTAKNVPIAAFNGSQNLGGGVTSCAVTSGTSPCFANFLGTEPTRYFAAQFQPGNTMRVGLYIRDVCQAFADQNGGTPAQGCATTTSPAGSTVISAAGTPATVILKFSVMWTNTFGNSLPPGADSNGGTALGTADTSTLYLQFENSASPTTCSDRAHLYFPGDGQIQVDTSKISLGTASTANSLIVVGKLGSTAPDTSKTFRTAGNDINDVVAFGGSVYAPGFQNTLAGGPANDYAVSFMVRDVAGLVPTVDASCQLTGVETSDIQGFLKKSNCFIATAAFRSIDAAPVAMLREFRDQILLPTHAGRAFVHWYYAWSPGAAEWLMKHPLFRFPVLVALVPVELIAWFWLHPFWAALVLAVFCSGVVIIAARIRADSSQLGGSTR